MATVLAPPPATAANRAAARKSRPGRSGRTFRLALALSAALHALLFATITFRFHVEPAPAERPLRAFVVADAMQAYAIEPVTVGFGMPEPEPLPERRLIPVPPPPELRAPVSADPGAPAENPAPGAGLPRTPSAAERLSRGYQDPQLLAPADRLPPEELTEAEWLRLRLAQQLGIYNDSVAIAAAAKARATDWTVTDKSGGKWGVSPGKIHLGNTTLPLPFGFAPTGWQREAAVNRQRSWDESQAQASRVEAAQTFEQRVKAIRARQEAARDSARKSGGGH